MLASRSGMDYSQGIQFETNIIKMKEAKELTMNNQPKKSNRSSDGVAPSSTNGLLQRIALWDLQLEMSKNRPWRWRYLSPKQKKGIRICSSKGREKMSGGRG